jgi:5'-3' exonuclease
MNQQRSRRFRVAQEAAEKLKKLEKIREELLESGQKPPPLKVMVLKEIILFRNYFCQNLMLNK